VVPLRPVSYEAGTAVVAAAEGHAAAAWTAAAKGAIDRMGQNMAIGQAFRQHDDAAGRPQAGAKKVTTPSGSASGIVIPVSSTA
jgi:hypothetical protein